MYKFLVLTLLVCQGMYEISGETKSESTDNSQIPPMVFGTFDNFSKTTPDLGGVYINGTHQIFYINSPAAWKSSSKWSNADKEIRPDYTSRNGIDAHKVHRRKVSWNTARQICVEEGGHLAAIRSKQELQAIKNLMAENSVEQVWVGFHDLFQEGDWITVLDEPLARMEWDLWTKKIAANPDNAGGNENCAVFPLRYDGINDDNCATLFPFVCKINISCN